MKKLILLLPILLIGCKNAGSSSTSEKIRAQCNQESEFIGDWLRNGNTDGYRFNMDCTGQNKICQQDFTYEEVSDGIIEITVDEHQAQNTNGCPAKGTVATCEIERRAFVNNPGTPQETIVYDLRMDCGLGNMYFTPDVNGYF